MAMVAIRCKKWSRWWLCKCSNPLHLCTKMAFSVFLCAQVSSSKMSKNIMPVHKSGVFCVFVCTVCGCKKVQKHYACAQKWRFLCFFCAQFEGAKVFKNTTPVNKSGVFCVFVCTIFVCKSVQNQYACAQKCVFLCFNVKTEKRQKLPNC